MASDSLVKLSDVEGYRHLSLSGFAKSIELDVVDDSSAFIFLGSLWIV